MRILVSGCLLGMPCRFDGEARPCQKVIDLEGSHELIPICPERLGGLESPRLPCEIDRTRRRLCVRQSDGSDITEPFVEGAHQVLAVARENECRLAILKAKSPSCGSDYVYDGTFTGTLTPGAGVTARLLRSHGVRVVSETRFENCTEALLASSSADTPLLETKRLVLRPITRDDADAIFELYADPDVGPDAGWEPHRSIDDTLTFIEKIASGPHVFGIIEKATGREMGSVGLLRDSFRGNTDCLMLGYALGGQWWGKGYMTEAVTEAVRYGFEDLGLSLVTANQYLFNTRSKRVIEKCGLTYEGTLRGVEASPDGIMQDSVSYSITREEYFSLRGSKLG